LQPMSMSMPSTCTKTSKQSAAQSEKSIMHEHIPHFIPRVLMPLNHPHVKHYCLQSLSRICIEYNLHTEQAPVCNIRSMVNCETFSYMKSIALLFLLINIDSHIKKMILDSETPAQQLKCANFFMNLRRHAVPNFMSNEGSEVIKFATQCQDLWSVA